MHYDDDYDDYPTISKSPGHSGVGVASFLLAVASGLVMLALFAVAVVTENEQADLDQTTEELLGGIAILSMCGSLLGVGLGIAGCFQHDRKNIFAILGIVFNGMILLTFGMLVVVFVFLESM